VNYILTLILVIFNFVIVEGQLNTNGVKFKQVDEKYNWRTKSKIQLDSFYYNLSPVNISTKYLHIRISKAGQIIDLTSDDSKNYEGFLTNEITEYVYEKVKQEEFEQSVAKRNYFETIPLSKFEVKSIIDSLLFSGQLSIPTDSLIPNWNDRFLHCNSIQFYYKIDEEYESKSYTCLWGQEDTMAYKNIITKNYDLIQSMLNLDSLYKNFMEKLPKGKLYSNDSYRMRFIMTNKQLQWWNKSKPKREYLSSIKKSVDRYLNTELMKQEIELKEIDCFESYRLKFGTNGKLKKILIQDYDKPKLYDLFEIKDYLTEKKEIRKCKGKIKRIFRKINLSSLNLEYDMERIISFDHEGEFQLRDETIY
jgi:hypothetical protein